MLKQPQALYNPAKPMNPPFKPFGGGGNVEFIAMMADFKASKRVLVDLLRKHTLLIEYESYNGRRIVEATYKGVHLLGKTPEDSLLLYNLLSGETMELYIGDIRIVRIYQ